MRAFPFKHIAAREILFHPEKPEKFEGDILEIGPGRGDFILSTAKRRPDKKLVAVEISKRRHFKLARRVDRFELTNVLLVQGDARIILPKYFPPETFEKIYVLFPDPWPKRRHIPQRLMSAEFITLLTERLKTGGSLFFATDFWSYADWVIDNIQEIKNLRSLGRPYFVTIDKMDDYGPSFYEQKWRDEGRAIYYMRYEKTGG